MRPAPLAANQALNLVITAIGRDLLTLIALVVVMLIQDPIMSSRSFVIAPPIGPGPAQAGQAHHERRARSQWQGGARTLETLQETVQGIRLVKSFTLEDQMRARFDANVAGVETRFEQAGARQQSHRAARRNACRHHDWRSLMVYAGYRVIDTDASPGEFFSFMTAFLLAYEPAKRLARLNLDLNAALVGVARPVRGHRQPGHRAGG